MSYYQIAERQDRRARITSQLQNIAAAIILADLGGHTDDVTAMRRVYWKLRAASLTA